MEETFHDAIPNAATSAAYTRSTVTDHEPSATALSEGSGFYFVGTVDGYVFSYEADLMPQNCCFTGKKQEVLDLFPCSCQTILVHQARRLVYGRFPNYGRCVNGVPEPQNMKIVAEIPLCGFYVIRPQMMQDDAFQALGCEPETGAFSIFTRDGQEAVPLLPPVKDVTDFVVNGRVLVVQRANVLFAYILEQGQYLLAQILDCRLSMFERNAFPVFSNERLSGRHTLSCPTRISYRGWPSYAEWVASEWSNRENGLPANDYAGAAESGPAAQEDFLLLVYYSARRFADIQVSYAPNYHDLEQHFATYHRVLVDCEMTLSERFCNKFDEIKMLPVIYKVPDCETELRKDADYDALALYRSKCSQMFGLISSSILLNALLYRTNCYYDITTFNFAVVAADIQPLKTVVATSSQAQIVEQGACCLVAVYSDDAPCVFLFKAAQRQDLCQLVPNFCEFAKNEPFYEREDEFDADPDGTLDGLRYCDIVQQKLREQRGLLQNCEGSGYPTEVALETTIPL